MLKTLYRINTLPRAALIWCGFLAALWIVFGAAYLTHPQAWKTGTDVVRQTGWEVFSYILSRNIPLLLLIVAGNLFVRFGAVTPGLIILAVQAVIIGWTAGTNGFMEPFPTVAEANYAFLRIGLWETTAYALLCAVTLPKSLLIASRFPAQKWDQQRSLKDLNFSKSEWLIAAAGIVCLIGAAAVEAFFPI
jgi:hypothetical protein